MTGKFSGHSSDRLLFYPSTVVEQSKILTAPFIKVFFSIRANAHIPTEIIDLSKSKETIVSIEDPLQWGLDLDKVQGV